MRYCTGPIEQLAFKCENCIFSMHGEDGSKVIWTSPGDMERNATHKEEKISDGQMSKLKELQEQ